MTLFVTLYLWTCVLYVQGKFLKQVEKEDNVVKAYAYREKDRSGEQSEILCALQYTHKYNYTGWDVIEGQTNPHNQTDAEQAQCIGELEGFVTTDAIWIHYFNVIKQWCTDREEICKKVFAFLDEHLGWIQQQIKEKGDSDPIWHQVDVFYSHINGLYTGYQENPHKHPNRNLTLTDFLVMNLQPDLDDVIQAVKSDNSWKMRGGSHCSAIVKLVSNNKDLLVGHNAWITYSRMYRMLKKYDMPLRVTGKSKTFVPTQMISFSGYPGLILSQDDFYITSSNLVVLETTIENYNPSRWRYVTPTGKLFDSVRSLAAMRLEKDGKGWSETFSQYNSGTYNNQWMIVDLKKFKKGKEPRPGTLWILEQTPGYVRHEDQTSRLISQGYWASYNIPFYEDVFNLSGYPGKVDEFGDWFSYNRTPRALIFKRDQTSVKDLSTLLTLLRSNDYKNDPYSRCNCSPPYSAVNAIAARGDLNPANGRYPFSLLGHRCFGAIDAKVTSPLLAYNLTFAAVNGPTTGKSLPLFRWSQSDCNTRKPHLGQPDYFKFDPITFHWQGPFF